MNFECQESCEGKCCKTGWGGAGFVFLTKSDRANLQLLIGTKIRQHVKFGSFTSTRFTLNQTDQWYIELKDGKCPFLEQGKCSVYSARPTQCRTFPYWPEVVLHPSIKEKFKEVCPGIDQGQQNDIKARSQLNLQKKADEELQNQIIKF